VQRKKKVHGAAARYALSVSVKKRAISTTLNSSSEKKDEDTPASEGKGREKKREETGLLQLLPPVSRKKESKNLREGALLENCLCGVHIVTLPPGISKISGWRRRVTGR